MAKLRLEESDLIINKSPRMPICIVIETSDAVTGDAANIRNIRRGLRTLTDDLRSSQAMRSLADICLISFGGSAKITRAFGVLNDGEELIPETISGEPDLTAALELMIREYQIRLNDYEANRIKRYTPIFVIISGDEQAEDHSPAISQLYHWSRTGKVSIIPVAVGGMVGNTLSRLTVSGDVYQMDSMNYEEIFNTLGKSIEMLSRSSANAVESLKLKSIDWNDFRRK